VPWRSHPHHTAKGCVKIFLIGGVSVEDSDPNYESQKQDLNRSMAKLGKTIAEAGHDLLVCSPFDGSADAVAALGALTLVPVSSHRSDIEFHHPDTPAVIREMQALRSRVPAPEGLKSFQHPTPKDERGNYLLEYGWLLSQTYAMDRSHGAIALGGKIGRSASLLLSLLDARKKPLLPLTFLGGASAQAFDRRRYLLEDRLGSKIAVLHDPGCPSEIVELLAAVSSEAVMSSPQSSLMKFFISYPRAKPCEADFVETALRRRQFDVFRDENDFAPGTPITGAIEAAIYSANVFIAIWSKEYACSDWCFDELTLALQRQAAGKLKVWILCVDNTRIIPPAARNLINYPARSREELERQVMLLLEQTRKPAAVTTPER
jgi:TIR domain